MAHVNKYSSQGGRGCEYIYPYIKIPADARKESMIVLNKIKKIFNIDAILIPSITSAFDIMIPIDGSEQREEWPSIAVKFLKQEGVMLEGTM